MDNLSGPSPQHPLLRCVTEIGAALDQAEGITSAGLRTEEKGEALLEVSRQIERLQGLKLTLMAAGEDVAAQTAARDIAAWLAPRVNADHGPTKALQLLAEAIEARWHRVGAALRCGACSLEQARVITKALDDLPAEEVGPELLGQAEAHLVAQAAHFTPQQLRRLGEKILEVIAPDAFEDQERKNLQDAQRRANAATRLNFRKRGDGSTDIHARVPDSVAARLAAYLDAFTNPRKPDPTDPTPADPAKGAGNGSGNGSGDGSGDGPITDPATGQRIPAERRRGHAFCALLEALDPDALPIHGGNATTLVVTIDWTHLHTGTGGATLADGTRISAGEARRLACTAGIIPAVLGADSEVLDLGRLSRLFSAAQKRALGIAHPTCRAEGCTIPAKWCEAHHFTDPWCQGGRTDLADGKLLCNWHHHRAHDDTYDTLHLPNGDVRFHKRT